MKKAEIELHIIKA